MWRLDEQVVTGSAFFFGRVNPWSPQVGGRSSPQLEREASAVRERASLGLATSLPGLACARIGRANSDMTLRWQLTRGEGVVDPREPPYPVAFPPAEIGIGGLAL